MSRIAHTFEALRQRGEKALVTYLTAGDPDLETSEQVIHALVGAGVDLLEIGFPFSDPMADGPTIQAAAERALAAGTTLHGVLALVARVRRHTNVPIVLMGYFNPVFRYGADAFARDAAAAGVDGLLLVDLPPEEAGELHPQLRAAGVDLITLLAPTTPEARMARLAGAAEGFLYYVSMTGVTGTQAVDPAAIAGAVAEVRRHSAVPVAVGFGVTTPDDARAVAGFADAVVVGSALVKVIATHAGSPRLIEEVQGFARALKAAVTPDAA
ncbi:MAG: tryptophan synthase subunit alpha [Deltaproteobacteria bacterium]|nr:MAG: tryptophan synthase subunit alpha [Deltaproteobacteria bacterium]